MLPITITLHDINGSGTLDTLLRKKAEKLRTYCQRIQSCRILVSLAQKRQRQGRLYNVRIELNVPGKHLAATNAPDESIHVAIRNAFLALRRQLEHYNKKRRHHASIQHHRANLWMNHVQD